MKKVIHIGSVSIPMDSYTIGGTAILGIRDSGKTYAAKGIAEQLLDADVPPIIFDPIGRWRFLKTAGLKTKNGKGYKIVVAGGENPDLPLTPESAPEIVRAAIQENIPLVLDFYDRKLSKADWRRIVQASFRTLMYENEGMRHIFLEEAAEFVPQKVFDNETYAEVEKVVRMGGNVSLGITLINQRAQEVNKAVLDLCENLVLMKQRGSHAIDSVEKWMDKLSPDTAKAVAKSLPHMGAGDAWVFTPSQEDPRRIKTATIRSFHPDRRNPQLTPKAAAARTADTEDFVSRLHGKLEEVIERAHANDPAALRRRVVELEKQLRTRLEPGKPTPIDITAIGAKAYAKGKKETTDHWRGIFKSQLLDLRRSFDNVVQAHLGYAANIGIPDTPEPVVSQKAPIVSPKPKIVSPAPRAGVVAIARNGDTLSKGMSMVLRALIMYPEGVSREKLAVLTGYKATSRKEFVSRLRRQGLAETVGDLIVATPEGVSMLPDAEPLPTGDKLLEFWRGQLSGGELKILDLLVEAFPDPVSRENLETKTGYKSTARKEFVSRLRRRDLATTVNNGDVRASDNLFSEFINP